ncbi:MAG: ABC transporter ATP-binding protein, partial [Thermoguttaceae bacterium]|nr:ABC transporter ATP-binding protein [Thermoguttaceae bacterium]
MSDVAIRVEKLSKRFILGERVGIKTFRETIQDLFTAPLRRLWKPNGSADEPKVDTDRVIWALKDVSFEVKHGEVLGIIGPNGAGKSTLLKILSRITEPTSGYAEIRGRVGSLLEVGTGFHPELTGRENVYLNGAILGMSRAEIRRKFDDIVSFAGVEKFIDTPVKRYSSGMQVRLAFAVAAHLDPEILIIDEVLAVGDAEFQKRCLGKMNEVARSGRTVLFVSHNLAAVEGLCDKGVLLNNGHIESMGGISEVLARYIKTIGAPASEWRLEEYARLLPRDTCIKSVVLRGEAGRPQSQFGLGEDITIDVEVFTERREVPIELSLRIYDFLGRRVLTCNNRFQSSFPIRITGEAVVRCRIRGCRIPPGEYRLVIVGFGDAKEIWPQPVLSFHVLPRDVYKTGRILPSHTTVWYPD